MFTLNYAVLPLSNQGVIDVQAFYVIVKIMQFIRSAEVDRFNDRSAALQQLAGVDPSQCLKLGVLPTNTRTPLHVLFPALQRGIWPSPQSGSWRDHDRRFHWPGVRQLHPQFAPVVMWAAAVGSSHLERGDVEAAIDVGVAIDYFVDRHSRLDNFSCLLDACDIETVEPAFNHTTLEEHRLEVKRLELVHDQLRHLEFAH